LPVLPELIETMHFNDIGVLLSLSLLEILLSADNAVVLAVVARQLDNPVARKHALTVGLACSFGLRLLGLLIASFLIKAWPLRALGAAYLIWVCVRHFAQRRKSRGGAEREYVKGPPTFGRVITVIALMDAAFALDTILVAVAVSNKLWLIYCGVLLGMVGLRIIAGSFLQLLEKYPALDDIAYLLIGWAGARLGCDAVSMFGDVMYQADWPAMPAWIFWCGLALIAIFGAGYARSRERRSD
jgi:YkoY family integral membrane protein